MKRLYVLLGSLTIFVAALLIISSKVYANDSQFDAMIQETHVHRAQMEAQLGIDQSKDTYPHATCYYDDKEAHYEQVLIRSDEIDVGIR